MTDPQLAMLKRLAKGSVGSSGGVHEARVLNNLCAAGLAKRGDNNRYLHEITEAGLRELGWTECACGCALASHSNLGRCENCDSNYGARIDCYEFRSTKATKATKAK